MKKFLALFILAFSITVQAQTDNVTETKAAKKKLPLHARLKLMNGSIEKAWLYMVTDSSVILLTAKPRELNAFSQSTPDPSRLDEVNAKEIQSISFQKKGARGRGALIGFGAGAITGAISGFAEGDDPTYDGPVYDPLSAIVIAIGNAFAMTAEEKAVVDGLAGGITGALIGYIIGATTKKKFIINGDTTKLKMLDDHIHNRVLAE